MLLLLLATPAVACPANKAPHRAGAHATRCAHMHDRMRARSRHEAGAPCAMMKADAMPKMAGMSSGAATQPDGEAQGAHGHDHGDAPPPK